MQGKRRSGTQLVIAAALVITGFWPAIAADQIQNRKPSATPAASAQKPHRRVGFAERDRRCLPEILKFLKERVGDPQSASLVSDSFDQGLIVIGQPEGGNSAEIDQLTKVITLSDTAAEGVVKGDGSIDFGSLVELTSSLLHELRHTRQGILGWTASASLDWAGGEHFMETEAYVGTLTDMAHWVRALQREMESKKSASDPCAHAQSAADLAKATGAWKNYFEQMKGLRPVEAEMLALRKERASLTDARMAAFRELDDARRTGPGLNRADESGKVVQGDPAELEAKRAEITARIGDVEKRTRDIDERSRLLADKFAKDRQPAKLEAERLTRSKAAVDSARQNLADELSKLKRSATSRKTVDETGKVVQANPQEQRAQAESLKTQIAQLDTQAEALDASIYENYKKLSAETPLIDWNTFRWSDGQGNTYNALELQDRFGKLLAETSAVAEKCKGWKAPAAAPSPFGLLGLDDKNVILACLCNCGSTSGSANVYRPEPVAGSPNCADPRNGPCAQGNFGCLRGGFPSSGPCFEACCKEANLIPSTVAEAVLDMRRGDGLSLMNEGTLLLGDLSAPSSVPQLDRIRSKARAGDIEKGAELLNRAGAVEPRLKGEVESTAAQFSREVSRLSGVPLQALDFETATRVLQGALALDKNSVDAKGRLAQVAKWRADWEAIKGLAPQIDGLLRSRRACEGKALFDESVVPLDRDFTIPITYANPAGGGSRGNERLPIPEKEKFVHALSDRANAAVAECARLSLFQVNPLRNYVQYRTHANYAGLNEEQVVKQGQGLLASPSLCDCQRTEVEDIVKTAEGFLQERRDRAQQSWNRAVEQEQRGDLRGAIESFDAARKIVPNPEADQRITALRNEITRRAGRVEEAARRIEEAERKERAEQQAEEHPAANSPGPSGPSKTIGTGNSGGVGNGPTAPTVFRVRSPARLKLLRNYHWNGARGASPGTIGVRRGDGTTLGPWRAVGSSGSGGAPNVYWTVEPNADLAPGTYTVVDSNPATWACNNASGGAGMSEITLVPRGDADDDFAEIVASARTSPSPRPTTASTPTVKVSAPGDITGTWKAGSAIIRFSASGNSYAGTIVSPYEALGTTWRAGEPKLRLTRVSAHVYHGQHAVKDSNGRVVWEQVGIGVDGDRLFMGGPEMAESDPTEGFAYARRN